MKQETFHSKWIINECKKSPKIRLFCFPYAGGGASVFKGWSEKIIDEVEICAIQTPGHEQRICEKPISSMTEIIYALCDEIYPLTDLPYVFFGHSLGGLECFALYREFIKRKYNLPKLLILSGCRPPFKPEPRPIYHLEGQSFIEALKNYNGTSEEVLLNSELMSFLFPMLKADFTLAEKYMDFNVEKHDIDITIMSGISDIDASPEFMHDWQEYTNKTFTQYIFQGDHFFINSKNDEIIERINYSLRNIIDI